MSTVEHDLGPDEGPPPDDMRRQTTLREKVEVLGQRNFILYWVSGIISFVGDNFAMIAMPLLITSLTDDATTLGLIMAVGGIPRIVLMLFGGAISDKLSPIRVMFWSRMAFAVCFAVFSWFLWTGNIGIPHIYAFSLVTSTIGSFLFPAQMALLPALVEQRDLPPANALNGGTQQILQAFAPAMVGFTIALLSGVDLMAEVRVDVTFEQEIRAYSWAFMVNVGTFVLAGFLLLWMRPLQNERAEGGVVANIMAGLLYIWRDPALRAFMIYIAVSQLFSMGAQMVGTPLMAAGRFQEWGMSKFEVLGWFGTASGIGAAIGSLAAGFLIMPSQRQYGPVMISLALFRGAALIGVGFFSNFYGILIMFGIFSVFMGYTMVLFMVWMQMRVEVSMLGRAMSVVMLASMGMAPLSLGFAGWAIDAYSIELLFMGSGAFMVLTGAVALGVPSMRLLGYSADDARKILAARRK